MVPLQYEIVNTIARLHLNSAEKIIDGRCVF